MVTQELIKFIQNEREKGFQDNQIRVILRVHGWIEKDIEDALSIKTHENQVQVVEKVEEIVTSRLEHIPHVFHIILFFFFFAVGSILLVASIYFEQKDQEVSRLQNIKQIKVTPTIFSQTPGVVKNKPYYINVKLLPPPGVSNKSVVQDVHIQVTDETGDFIYYVTTDKDGIAKCPVSQTGEYTVHVTTPNGFQSFDENPQTVALTKKHTKDNPILVTFRLLTAPLGTPAPTEKPSGPTPYPVNNF